MTEEERRTGGDGEIEGNRDGNKSGERGKERGEGCKQIEKYK
jgi:hypothetical protein